MPAATSRRTSSSSALLVIVTAYLIFIVLGFPDGMLGIAWPSIMGTFGLQNAQMGTLLLASTLGFLITSFNVGRLIGWFGITNLLIAANVLRAAGLLGMGLAPEWPLLVASAFFFGLGSGAIDGGLNTYFAMNLPSPRLMNWLHASFGLGATVGPLMMTTLLSIGGVWRWGYLIVAAVQVGMGLLVWARAGVWQARTDTPAADSPATRTSSRATLARPIVWVNIAIFFCYAGVEVTAGNWSYSLFTEARGVAVAVAGFWASLYWGSFTLGTLLFRHRGRSLCRHPDRARDEPHGHRRRTLHLVESRRLGELRRTHRAGLCHGARFPTPDYRYTAAPRQWRRQQRHRLPGCCSKPGHRPAARPGRFSCRPI